MKLLVANLNQSTTEKDLNELFGLECTPYLQKRCNIEMPKDKRMGQSKVFAFLNIPAQFREEIIKPDGIKYKNQTIKIEKAHTQALLLDLAQLLIIILKTKICLFEIFLAIRAMLKLRFHQTAQGLPTKLFLG